jgi:hypothetical protein
MTETSYRYALSKQFPTILIAIIIPLQTAVSCSAQDEQSRLQLSTAAPVTEVVHASEIEWQPLNPARGDKGPKAGTLWGDQTKDGASGFLVKFIDGFSSPPHIHNITYRGIVVGGRLHNDDPDAALMWMSEGSYWTQPAGEVHITAARGSSIAYVEIQSGPYLVKPAEDAFDRGERPVNVDASNIVWLDASSSSWIEDRADSATSIGPEIAFLWGNPNGQQINGTMLKLPAGFSGELIANAETLKAVVINGGVKLKIQGEDNSRVLSPGSYFGTQGAATHYVTSDEESLVYIRANGQYTVGNNEPKAP